MALKSSETIYESRKYFKYFAIIVSLGAPKKCKSEIDVSSFRVNFKY